MSGPPRLSDSRPFCGPRQPRLTAGERAVMELNAALLRSLPWIFGAIGVGIFLGYLARRADAEAPAYAKAMRGRLDDSARIVVCDTPDRSGIWLNCRRGSVALVASDTEGAYVAIRGTDNAMRAVPDLVLRVDGAEPVVEVRAGEDGAVRRVPLSKLLDLAR